MWEVGTSFSHLKTSSSYRIISSVSQSKKTSKREHRPSDRKSLQKKLHYFLVSFHDCVTISDRHTTSVMCKCRLSPSWKTCLAHFTNLSRIEIALYCRQNAAGFSQLFWKEFHIVAIEAYLSVSESCSVVSDCLWPHGLYNPWNSPGKNTAVGSCFLPKGSSQPRDQTQVSHTAGGFFTSWATREASPRILEWVAYSFSRGSFRPRNRTGVSCIAGRFFTTWTTREAPKWSKRKLIYIPSLNLLQDIW